MKKGYLLVILLCALMAGCSSTYSSRKLAENTAANAVLFASEIQKSEESQLRLLKAREKNIKQFSNKLIRAQQQIEFLKLQVDDGVQNKVEKELHLWLKKLKEMQIAMQYHKIIIGQLVGLSVWNKTNPTVCQASNSLALIK